MDIIIVISAIVILSALFGFGLSVLFWLSTFAKEKKDEPENSESSSRVRYRMTQELMDEINKEL